MTGFFEEFRKFILRGNVVDLAVVLVGLLIGSRAGFAALCVYLMEGAAGLPVFTPGPGGVAQLLGPTGGFLLAYPFVAWLAGFLFERWRPDFGTRQTQSSFFRALIASTAAELLLFAGGLSWLFVLTRSLALAFRWGLYWFVLAEIIKIMLAAGTASAWQAGRRMDV